MLDTIKPGSLFVTDIHGKEAFSYRAFLARNKAYY